MMHTDTLQTAPRLDFSWLPETPLYGGAEADGFGWQLSPAPFALSEKQLADLKKLGALLQRFMQAIDTLYRASRNPNLTVPSWVADLYDQGKPDDLLRFSQMKRLKNQLPLVLRPDLLLTEDGWRLVEIDAVPGGIGFTSALNRFYRQNGLPVLEAEGGMPGAFLKLLKAQAPEVENPVIAIVLSDEAADYRAEMAWLVDTLRAGSDLAPPYENIFLLHPRELELVRDRLVFRKPLPAPSQDTAAEEASSHGADEASSHAAEGAPDQASAGFEETPVDLIYRFFELFDLPNIPKIELIQYAVKKGFVRCTPPFKPQVEEKLSLALLHHPALAGFWKQELGQDALAELQAIVPRGWVLDPSPLPPQAVIPDLTLSGQPVQDFRALKAASQKERALVVKPSGFSELAWGSRGVTIGHDYPAEEWSARLEAALTAFVRTPHILQHFEPAAVQTLERLKFTDPSALNYDIAPFKARTRLCPYYFITANQATLVGALATSTPADKKLVHGMKDAVLAPCQGGQNDRI